MAEGSAEMDFEPLLKYMLKPALGCTEPAAIGLCVAAASQAAVQGWRPLDSGGWQAIGPDQVLRVAVRVTPGLFKNAYAIEIPNTRGERGVPMAAALGLFCNPEFELELFQELDAERIAQARELSKDDRFELSVRTSANALRVDASVLLREEGEEFLGTCRIEGDHTRIVALARNGGELLSGEERNRTTGDISKALHKLGSLRIADLLRLSAELSPETEAWIWKAIRMNKAACDAGLRSPLGLGTGFHSDDSLWEFHERDRMSATAAAGSDARMTGYPMPVMSLAGSGNQGFAAIIPVVEFAEAIGCPRGELTKAVALSSLVTLYVTFHLGLLTALCGVALKASIGAACGLVRLKGGGEEELTRAIRLMIATHAGMICDGAKPGCALKVFSASEMALRAADLAMQRVDVQDPGGIVAETAEKTVRNLARLQASMDSLDRRIIEIVQEES